jgi:LPS-assembly lipoprotein
MAVQRRSLLLLLAAAPLGACGFKLRASQELPFSTIAVSPENAGGVAGDLARYIGSSWRPLAPGADGVVPEATVYILQEVREKIVVALNASGQVREYELRLRVNFRLVSKGEETIAPAFIEQRRSISFNESAVLAKESEEALLYRDMQSDVVQQLLRRIAAIKPVAAQPAAATVQ